MGLRIICKPSQDGDRMMQKRIEEIGGKKHVERKEINSTLICAGYQCDNKGVYDNGGVNNRRHNRGKIDIKMGKTISKITIVGETLSRLLV